MYKPIDVQSHWCKKPLIKENIDLRVQCKNQHHLLDKYTQHKGDFFSFKLDKKSQKKKNKKKTSPHSWIVDEDSLF